MKALFWEGDGFILLYKRLENGKYKWPRTPEQVRLLTVQEFRWLMEGLSIDQPKAIRNVKPGEIC
jgi:transposase